MPSFMLAPLTGRFLSFAEREEIAMLKAQGAGVRRIARELHRDPSRISRELRRNAATRGGKLDYRPSVAQWKAELLARRPKTAKLVANERLREYVQDRRAGTARRVRRPCCPQGTGNLNGVVKQLELSSVGWRSDRACHAADQCPRRTSSRTASLRLVHRSGTIGRSRSHAPPRRAEATACWGPTRVRNRPVRAAALRDTAAPSRSGVG